MDERTSGGAKRRTTLETAAIAATEDALARVREAREASEEAERVAGLAGLDGEAVREGFRDVWKRLNEARDQLRDVLEIIKD